MASARTSPPPAPCPPRRTALRSPPLPKYRKTPHAYVKLWKHHAAQPEANRINEIGRERNEEFIRIYGGKYSSEWFFSKLLQVVDEAPAIYDAMDRFIEAGGLDRVATDRRREAQHLHGRLQRHVGEGPGISLDAISSARCIRAWKM